MTRSYSILYVGDLWLGSTSLQRCEALRALGHSVGTVDTLPESVAQQRRSFGARVRWKLYRLGFDAFTPRDLAGANRAILDFVAQQKIDMLWIDKGLTIDARTMQAIKGQQPECKLVGYSPDDMNARHAQSRQFLEHLPLYDIYFTTKSYGVAELKARGVRRVEFIGNAFDPQVHRPRSVSNADREGYGGAVGFIGDFERERAESISSVAAAGVAVRIWGPWKNRSASSANLRVEGRALWHDEYAKAICSFDINLCFLRKANRDLQTTRSIEIPACGGFMLAERTAEHQELFTEGEEAEFFSSDDELIDKTRFYLRNSEARQRIARAGRERCLLSGYSNTARAQQMLDVIESLQA